MARYVAFLRGMNLGNRRIKNDELCRHVSGLGFDGVATFRASGNVIFDADGKPAEISSRMEQGLAEALGYEVPIFLRDENEVREIAGRDPFDHERVSASKGKIQVAFLLRKPGAKAGKEVLALASEEDALALEGRELYWLPSGGISESDLDLQSIAAALGPTTIRTKGTVDQIAAKHLGP